MRRPTEDIGSTSTPSPLGLRREMGGFPSTGFTRSRTVSRTASDKLGTVADESSSAVNVKRVISSDSRKPCSDDGKAVEMSENKVVGADESSSVVGVESQVRETASVPDTPKADAEESKPVSEEPDTKPVLDEPFAKPVPEEADATQADSTQADAALPNDLPAQDVLAGLLPADSLGRLLWRHLLASPTMADARSMLGDNAQGLLLLPNTPPRASTATDPGALLNDNILFTDQPLHSDEPGPVQFTSVSGICGIADRGTVSARGTLPVMEDLMAAVSQRDAPHATIFDVMGTVKPNHAPLVRLRVVAARNAKLPDGRSVQVLVTSAPLDRALVVDSAVSTLAARVHAQVSSVFSTLVPKAPPITADERVTVAIDRIMQFAHSVELRAAQGAAELRGPFAWIAGRHGARGTAGAEGDSTEWQAVMQDLQQCITEHLDDLEQETSLCGDAEKRRHICDALLETVEEQAMEALYPLAFSPRASDDRQLDARLAIKVIALNHADVNLEYLGLAAAREMTEAPYASRDLGLTTPQVSGVRAPALQGLHELLAKNVFSSVGIDVVQGVADGGKKVAVGVFDATVGRLLDAGLSLGSRAPWRSTTAVSPDSEKEMRQTNAPLEPDDDATSLSPAVSRDPLHTSSSPMPRTK
ncbi:hypothetical protein GGI07_002656 [Coemansia sp. Benny D115]|nr:hypothetical protein GGI07_002656 [Coemansia sp. Benny D115]